MDAKEKAHRAFQSLKEIVLIDAERAGLSVEARAQVFDELEEYIIGLENARPATTDEMDAITEALNRDFTILKQRGIPNAVAEEAALCAMSGWNNTLALPHDLWDELHALDTDQERFEKLYKYFSTGKYTTRWDKPKKEEVVVRCPACGEVACTGDVVDFAEEKVRPYKERIASALDAINNLHSLSIAAAILRGDK